MITETAKDTREYLLGETVNEHFARSNAPIDELRGVVSVLVQEGRVVGIRGPRRIVEGVKEAFWGLDEFDGYMRYQEEMDCLKGLHKDCGHSVPDGQPATQLPEHRPGAPRKEA